MAKPAFNALKTGTIPGWQFHHTVHDLGILQVPSGRLEANDPFVTLGEGFEVPIPPGAYPVRVTVADVSPEQDGSHLRETYLSLIVAEGEIASVEYLVPPGDPALAEDSEDYYGIGVGAGTVGFVDAEAASRCMPEGDWYTTVFDTGAPSSWFALMDAADHLRPGSANVTLPKATAGENLVLTHSGWGDGFYPLVGAFDADRQLLSVHIDLEVDEPAEV